MIKREQVNGKTASVAYLKADLTPADSVEEAELLRVLFDNGDSAWLTPKREDADEYRSDA
jgi:hypothetical protein